METTSGDNFRCADGIHITQDDNPVCINCGFDTRPKSVPMPPYGFEAALPVAEKVIQIAPWEGNLCALTNKGRMFEYIPFEEPSHWNEIIGPDLEAK